MAAPAALAFSGLIACTGWAFIVWHMWHFDKLQCLISFRKDWFRTVMCWVLLASVGMFITHTWLDTVAAYDQASGHVIPKPWQLWPKNLIRQSIAAIYVSATGWGFLQLTQLEEILYWGYLTSSVPSSGITPVSWLRSTQFKLWCAGGLVGFGALYGVLQIETSNLDLMRVYLFLVGGCMSLCLCIANIIGCLRFPASIKRFKKHGASVEVMERLYFFQEVHQFRTLFRVLYSVAVTIICGNSLTTGQAIARNTFASDFLYLISELAIFAAFCTSVLLLLPRNMTSEAKPPPSARANSVFQPLPRYSISQNENAVRRVVEIGARLNVDPEELAPFVKSIGHVSDTYELSDSTKHLAAYPQPMSTDPELLSPPMDGLKGREGRVRFSSVPVV